MNYTCHYSNDMTLFTCMLNKNTVEPFNNGPSNVSLSVWNGGYNGGRIDLNLQGDNIGSATTYVSIGPYNGSNAINSLTTNGGAGLYMITGADLQGGVEYTYTVYAFIQSDFSGDYTTQSLTFTEAS